jgi:hypothetical protein
MPDSWNSEQYRERAKAWRDRAASLPDGSPERDACVILAEGYQRLAEIFEARGSAWRQGGDHNPLSAGVSGLGPSRVA